MKDFDNFESVTAIHDLLIALIQKLGLKNGQVLWPLRAALSGEQYSPGVFELIWVLGKEAGIGRIEKALAKFG